MATSNDSQTVAIAGAGIAGMTVAHELVRRGYKVTLYESSDVVGGKARSYRIPQGQSNNHSGSVAGMPAEHGFRLVPGFYRHLREVLAQIQADPQVLGPTVLDRLKPIPNTWLVSPHVNEPPVKVPNQTAPSPGESDSDLFVRLGMELNKGLRLRPEELRFLFIRLVQFTFSCDERRFFEFDKVSWKDYIQYRGTGTASTEFRENVSSLVQWLVAADPRKASTATMVKIALQLFYDQGWHGRNGADFTFDGPTSEVWLDPWRGFLERRGVKFRFGAKVLGIKTNDVDRTAISMTIQTAKRKEDVVADWYVCALPLTGLAQFFGEFQAWKSDSSFRHNPGRLAKKTGVMAGVQLFIRTGIGSLTGHQIYLKSNWALTSVSQRAAWGADFTAYVPAESGVADVLSVAISNWNRKGDFVEKHAVDCTPAEIIEEVWESIKASLNQAAGVNLEDRDLIGWAIDESVQFKQSKGSGGGGRLRPNVTAEAKLLVNETDTYSQRPDSHTAIKNVFIAGDYTRTNTDLACMEGATESGRRAANSLLSRMGSIADVPIYELEEPHLVNLLKSVDQNRYEQGVPLRLYNEFEPEHRRFSEAVEEPIIRLVANWATYEQFGELARAGAPTTTSEALPSGLVGTGPTAAPPVRVPTAQEAQDIRALYEESEENARQAFRSALS